MTDLSKLNIALVYDRVNKWGGAERVLLALHEIFPNAPLYTSVYNESTAQWAKVFPEIIPTFLQYFPGAKSHHEFYPWLTPLAFESLNFNQYDVVISITSADSKGIITRPGTFHLCYCLTPTRYLWSHEKYYKSQTPQLFHPLFNYLKSWDQIAAYRPDAYVAISQTVQNRISSFYHQSSFIVYPPVDIDVYSRPVTPPSIKDFFLYVGRLIGYKQPQTIINIFNELNLPLVIVGTGAHEKKLKSISRSHIHFTGLVSQETLISYYQNAKAFISVHEEDFGIVYVEAQAAGKPVLALNSGGVSEIVIHNQTGYLASDLDDLKSSILNFSNFKFDPLSSIVNSQRFSKQRFQQEFVKVFTTEWKKYKNIYTS